jgi:hypothetical protein
MSDSKSVLQDTRNLDESTLHDLLSSERRRHVLSCLAEHGSMALPDLADEVAAREHDAPLPQVPEDAVLTTYLSLYHTHVPKLTGANVVSYNQDRDIVALASDTTAFDGPAPLDGAVRGD